MKAKNRFQAMWFNRGWLPGFTLLFAVIMLVALLVIYLPKDVAVWVHVRLGYYFSLAAFLALGWYIYRCLSREKLVNYTSNHWKGLAVAVLAGVSPQWFQDPLIQVGQGEEKQQIMAQSMHEWRQISVPIVGYHLGGQLSYGKHRFVGTDDSFYPFLVSLVHDLGGFRVENGWWVNIFLGAALVILLYLIGTFFCGPWGGLFAVLLASALPRLDIAATGFGGDLCASVFLALLFFVSLCFVQHPSSDRLALLVVAGIVLAMARSELALFLIYVALVVGFVAIRKRGDLSLGWFVSFSPIFLISVIAMIKISGGLSQVYGGLSEGIDCRKRIAETGAWLFDFSASASSFPLVSFFGVIGLVSVFTTVLLSLLQMRRITVSTWLALIFTILFLISFLLAKGRVSWDLQWGDGVHLGLPLQFWFVVLSSWWLSGLKVPDRFMKNLFFTVAAMTFVLALPGRTESPRGNDAALAQHADWALKWMEEGDDGRKLYVTPWSSLFLLHGYPTVSWHLADSGIQNLMQLLREGYYDDVVGFVIERFDALSDSWQPLGATQPLGDRIITREIEQRRYAYNLRARFFAIEGYRDGAGTIIVPGDLDYLKEGKYRSLSEYAELMLSIHPGYLEKR